MFDRRRIAHFDAARSCASSGRIPTSVLPVTLVVLICLVLPFLVLKIVPSATGQSIANDDMLRKAVAFASKHLDEFAALSSEHRGRSVSVSAISPALPHRAPVCGSVALAAHSVVGEPGQDPEPLLTTPVGTSDCFSPKCSRRSCRRSSSRSLG